MPKKKIEFPSEEEEFEEVWDPRKIVIGVVVVIILLIGGYIAKRAIMGESLNPADMIPKLPSFSNVLGAETARPINANFSFPSQDDVQKKMLQIQQQVTHLDVNAVASSSPEVRQILEQIQNLPKAGGDQAKQVCYRLCNNL